MKMQDNQLFLQRFYGAALREKREYPWKRAAFSREKPAEEYSVEETIIYETEEKQKMSGRSRLAMLALLILAPLTLWFGITFLNDRKYMFVSLLLCAYAMAPFMISFEGRKPKAREIMVLAVMAALTVAGRAAFFMLPNFKPVAAMVIISGAGFGPESGFLVGALSILVSNFLFGQGPWTPWQMLSYGLIGFFSGCIFQRRLLAKRPYKFGMCCYGFLSVIFIFGGIMNPASLIMGTGTVTWKGLLAYYISGIPIDLVHASSTVLFLLIGARPMLEKLERIRVKYGLIMN